MLKQTARENNGHAQFVEGVITNVAGSVSYEIPTTSASGFSAVLVQPMGRCQDDKSIKVIFSLSNLYSVGFVYQEVLYHYEDANVSSIAITEATKRFIVKVYGQRLYGE
jgi:hypothetical protein